MNKRSKILLVVGVTILTGLVATLWPRVSQDPAYHRFADTRGWLEVPNFENVVSNLAFVFVGVFGFRELTRRQASSGVRVIFAVLFAGIFLTGFGSAYYHWAPDNNRLIWDRIPMTIVFMSLLAAAVGEWIDRRAGMWSLGPLVAFGVASVLWWHHTEALGVGDLRLYGWVQFFPMICIPLILILFGRSGGFAGVRSLAWVVAWYAVAKVLEHFDSEIYLALGVSGHTLKHLAGAVSTVFLVGMFRERYAKARILFDGEQESSVAFRLMNGRAKEKY